MGCQTLCNEFTEISGSSSAWPCQCLSMDPVDIPNPQRTSQHDFDPASTVLYLTFATPIRSEPWPANCLPLLALPLPHCHELDLDPGLNLAITAWKSPCSDLSIYQLKIYQFINSLDSWLCIPWDHFYPSSASPIKFTMIFNSLNAHLILSPLPQTLLCLNKPYPFGNEHLLSPGVSLSFINTIILSLFTF